MARTFNGTSQSIECVSPVSSVPLTISAWVYPTTVGINQVAASVGVGSGGNRFQMGVNLITNQIEATAVQSGTAGIAAFPATIALNQWHHICAVFSSSTSRTAYFNGVAGTPNTTSIAPSGVNRINIGARYNTTLGLFFSGAIAEVSVYNAELSAEEIADLAQGFNPRLIRPQNRVHWNRLIRESQDIQRGAALTEIGGATTVATHPRIIYP
jgi:hypothetical protein